MFKDNLLSMENARPLPALSMMGQQRSYKGAHDVERPIPESVRKSAEALGLPKPGDRRGVPLRVLVSDDDRQLNKLMMELLRTWSERLAIDVDIEGVFDGFDTEARVAIFMPNIVLLDLTMPRLDGFSVCRKIKADAHTNHIRVVALSGHASQERIDRILNAGADRFVRKPFSSTELLEACGLAEIQRARKPKATST